MKANVKNYNGTPTLFLNGQPAFAGCQLLGSLDPNYHNLNQQLLRVYAQAGIHIYSIDCVGPEWCGPRPGNRSSLQTEFAANSSHFDFSFVAPRLQEVVDADPEALFLLRMSFETRGLQNNWWNQMYPDELEVLSDGTRLSQSFASTVWQNEVKELLRGYIGELRASGMYDRVIAYQIATGTCGEWIKSWSSMGVLCGDYSAPMRRHFRAWLRTRYQGDVSALQKAWTDADIRLDSPFREVLVLK